jgi:tetratricopeptide (TPR) repeat protein
MDAVTQPDIDQIFKSLLPLSPDQRLAQMDEVCAGDEELRRSLEQRLAKHDWREKVFDLYESARGLSDKQRPAFLRERCGGDEDLRREVEAMLAGSDSRFLGGNAMDAAARIIADEQTEGLQSQPESGRRTPGSFIGRYRLIVRLGEGGMGEVWQAEDTELRRDVAIKFLTESRANDPEWLARFDREGRLQADLNHPNIATVYGKEQIDGTHFLALELAPGEMLADRLHRGSLTIDEALPIFRQIADALDHAHRQNIVHRDLKPSNIMLVKRPDGGDQVKVLDFGLAKKFASDNAPTQTDFSRLTDKLTRSFGETPSGMIMGTLPYMSPEQACGDPLDQRTDLWAYGCVFYEALTGRRAFGGKSNDAREVLLAIINRDPTWRSLPGETPKEIRRLLRQCLQKDLSARLPSACEAIRAIDEARPPLRPFAWPKVWWRQAIYVATVALLMFVSFLAGMRAHDWWLIPQEKHLAVLPFNDASAAQTNRKLGAGLAKALRDLLAGTPELQVKPQSQVAQTVEPRVEPARLMSKLGANLILSGEVREESDQVAIHFRVLNARMSEITSGVERGPKSQLADLQLKVAGRVARALKLEFRAPAAYKPSSAEDLYLQVVSYLQSDLDKDSFAQLFKLLEDLSVTESDSARFQALLAQARLRRYQFDGFTNPADLRGAQNASERALQLSTNEAQAAPEVKIIQAIVHTYNEKHQEAINIFKEVLNAEPTNPDALMGLARAYEDPLNRQRDLEIARQYYLKMIEAWPNYWGGYNELGAFYFENGQFREALEEWRKVVALDPESASGHSNLCIAHIKLGNYSQAVYECNLALRKSAPEIYANLSAALIYQENYAEAIAQIEHGLALDGKMPALWGNRGDAHSCMLDRNYPEAAKDYTQAIRYGEQQLQALPSDDPGFADIAVWYAKRSVAERASDPQRSAADAREAIRKIRNVLYPDERMAPRKNQNCFDCLTSGVLVYHLTEELAPPAHRRQSLEYLRLALTLRRSPFGFENDPFLRALRMDGNYQRIISQYR